MRKVKFKKWIKGELSDLIYEGLFHIWGNDYEEMEIGAGNFTVAIVELPDGSIEEVLPKNIKFDIP